MKLIDKNIKIKLVEPGIYKTGFNRFMIENSQSDKYYLFNKSVYELEKEILNNQWLIIDANKDLILDEKDTSKWKIALSSLGINNINFSNTYGHS